MSVDRRRRSRLGPVLSGAVVILAGFAIALVEALRLPKLSMWGVVVGAVLVISAIRLLTRARG